MKYIEIPFHHMGLSENRVHQNHLNPVPNHHFPYSNCHLGSINGAWHCAICASFSWNCAGSRPERRSLVSLNSGRASGVSCPDKRSLVSLNSGRASGVMAKEMGSAMHRDTSDDMECYQKISDLKTTDVHHLSDMVCSRPLQQKRLHYKVCGTQ